MKKYITMFTLVLVLFQPVILFAQSLPENVPDDTPIETMIVDDSLIENLAPESDSESETEFIPELPVEPESELVLDIPSVYINEILPDPAENDAENEFIEIYNAGNVDVDLLGWRLDDSKLDDSSEFIFEDGGVTTLLLSGEYRVLMRTETEIVLNNDIDSVYLFNADGIEIDSHEFLSPSSGRSIGRKSDLIEEWQIFPVPTPGGINIHNNNPPVSIIEIQQDSKYMKLNVTGESSFDSDGDQLTFLWEFEDGIFDERQNPLIYEYLTEGDKTVSLMVTDEFGSVAEASIVFSAALKSDEDQVPEDPVPEPEPEPIPDPDIPFPLVYINEILPNPDGDDAENEWIEIYNAGDVAVNLLGWKLDDSKLFDDKEFVFMEEGMQTNFLPGEYRVLTRPQTNIILNNDIDFVYLFNADGIEIDSHEFESPSSGRSIGRKSDFVEEWQIFPVPTPWEANIHNNTPPVPVIDIQKDTAYMKLNVTGENSFDLEGDTLNFLWEFEEGVFDERPNPLIYEYVAEGEKIVHLTVTDEFGEMAEANIVFTAVSRPSGGGSASVPSISYPHYSLINEFIPNPDGTDTENEWLELYNNTSRDIDLSGWYLDDDEGASSPYKIPNDTILREGLYMVFYAPDLKLSFKNSEDVVRLLDPNKKVSDKVRYSEVFENWSFSKNNDGNFMWTPLFSPGLSNEFPDPPKSYNKGAIIFDSVLPNPEGTDKGNERIILKNLFDEEIDLIDWSLGDLKSTKNLPSIIVKPGEDVDLYSEDFRLTLNNSDEKLFLYDPVGNLIDEIAWKRSASGAWLFNPDALQDGLEAKVLYVSDGDTFAVSWEGKKFKIRLLGVDTPETVHPFKPVEYYGRQASDYLKKLLENQMVHLEFDVNKMDKYGRVLAYVYLDDFFINAELIKQGYGYAYTRFPFKYFDDFVLYELQAKKAKVGIWQNQKVKKLIEEEALMEEEIPDEEFEEMLILIEDELAEEVLIDEVIEQEVVLDCRSEFLKIDSFLPNHNRGESVEYIRLMNSGTETVCLSGWQLDDIADGGSKPFAIKGGSIAAGGIRNFRKQETKLTLNNKDDCVNLINQDGKVIDKICYDKTHKNEIFTHTGGDWTPKKRSKKKSVSSSGIRHSFKRDEISYYSELPVVSYVGIVTQIDEESEIITMTIKEHDDIRITYANSPVNIAMTRQLIDLSQPVKAQVYEAGDDRNLLSISPIFELSVNQKSSKPFQLPFLFIFLFVVPLSYFLFIRSN